MRLIANGAEHDLDEAEDPGIAMLAVLHDVLGYPRVPGGFRRVKGRWSTARQVQADAFIKRGKADEMARAAMRAQQEAARLMVEVSGDADALLWDYRDQGRAAA